MDRKLTKKAFEIQLYHGTNLSKLKNITDSGLIIPQESKGGGSGSGVSGDFAGFSFFATTINKASLYATWVATEEDIPVIIELALPESSLMPDDDDCPNCNTWQESADKIQQVKVLGSIDSSYFNTIHFLDFETYDVVGKAPFRSWESEFEKLKDTLIKELVANKNKRLIKKNKK